MLWVQLHRRSLRHANALDLIAILKAVSVSSLLFWVTTFFLFRRLLLPPAVFLIGRRFSDSPVVRSAFWQPRPACTERRGPQGRKARTHRRRGGRAATVLKELTLDSRSLCRPVAIVDDDPHKWGRSICGVRVEGGTTDLGRIVAEKKAGEILICIPSASRSQMREVLKACRESNIPVRTLPSISELVGGRVSGEDFRRPRIEDLLQRDGIEVDARETRNVVGGKTVLVTGAGGSIGSELCRQIAAANPRKLLLLDHSENSLFYAHLEAREQLGPTARNRC